MTATNVFIAAMRNGRVARGVFAPFPDPGCVEILKRRGPDFIAFHGESGGSTSFRAATPWTAPATSSTA